jgi:lincosamide nucleotidyltransferase A/C/D/E
MGLVSVSCYRERMTSADVLDLYRTMFATDVAMWIDGGWGVDALLGEQTRFHKDLDIAIEERHVPMLFEVLSARRYTKVKAEDARPWNFVLGDENGKEVDVHGIVLDENGNGQYGPAENGEFYPAASLTGSGLIAGQTVRCISAEWAVKFHSGYELKEKDFRDVTALCQKFGIGLPATYERFKGRK